MYLLKYTEQWDDNRTGLRWSIEAKCMKVSCNLKNIFLEKFEVEVKNGSKYAIIFSGLLGKGKWLIDAIFGL